MNQKETQLSIIYLKRILNPKKVNIENALNNCVYVMKVPRSLLSPRGTSLMMFSIRHIFQCFFFYEFFQIEIFGSQFLKCDFHACSFMYLWVLEDPLQTGLSVCHYVCL